MVSVIPDNHYPLFFHGNNLILQYSIYELWLQIPVK
jgi:hypothetical protein